MLGGFIIPYKKTTSLRHKKSKNRNNMFGKKKTSKTSKTRTKKRKSKSKSKSKRMYGGSDCNNGLQFTGKFDAIGIARYH
jgi:hypothetical protein|tara:strand:- start:9205 stop:9444 length:240 start_codon:yes stop_codon:yes gene_type:complete